MFARRINSAFLLTATAAIIWGATAPIMKLTLTEIPIFSLAFIRMLAASLILAVLISKKLTIKKADWPNFILAAIAGVTLNLSFFFLGLKLTDAINASFLVASVPILTIFAAHFYLKEKIGIRLILAALVAFGGTAVIIGKPYGPVNFSQMAGNLLLLAAGAFWVIHEMIAKKLLKIYDAGTVAFYSMAIGAVSLFIPFLIEFFKNPAWVSQVTAIGAGGLIYGIIFSSLIAYWAWQKGLSILPAGQASFFFYLDPVSGAALSIILLGEKLTPQLLVGGALIAAGVILAEHHRKYHPLHK